MKYILVRNPLLILVLSLLLGCQSNGKDKKEIEITNDLRKENLNGNVKTIKRTYYDVVVEKFGPSKGKITDYTDVQYISYNKYGNKIEINSYEPNGDLNYNDKYQYSNNILQEVIEYDKQENLKYKFKYKYENPNIKVSTYNSDGSLKSSREMKYDTKGNEIENIFFTEFGKFMMKTIFKYDDDGNQIEEIWEYSSKTIKNISFSYKYDGKGNQIQVIKYDNNGDVVYKFDYKYEFDNQKNWIKRTDYEYGKQKYIYERKIEYY